MELLMSVKTQADPALVINKAYNNACQKLGLTKIEKSKILGLDPSTLSRKSEKGFAPESITGQLQLSFIRLYRSLYAIAGGDNEFMKHWYSTENKALNGVPKNLCLKIEGLVRANQYLSAMRGKI